MSTYSLFPPSGKGVIRRPSASSAADFKDTVQLENRPGLLERIVCSLGCLGCLGFRNGHSSNKNESAHVTWQGSRSTHDTASPSATHAGEGHEESIITPTTSQARSWDYQSYEGSTLHQATTEGYRDSFLTSPTLCSSIVDDTSITTSISGNLNSEQIRRRERDEENKNYLFFRLAGGKLSDGHIDYRANILCTGSGAVAWAIELALKYRQSKVVVLDNEPYSTYLPPNCTIEAGNIAEYPRNLFWDYLFVRNLRSIGDWGAYFDHLRGIVRPEGHIELVDIDDAYDVVCTCSQPGEWDKIYSVAITGTACKV